MHAGTSSRELTDKGKGIETPVDLDVLQQRIFDLEQDSSAKELRIKELEENQRVRDLRITEMEESHIEKDSQIKELQANIGGLTALYYDLQQKLITQFGEKFASSAFSFQKSQDELHTDTAAESAEAVEKYLSAPSMSKEKSDRIHQKIMIMKNSDQNVSSSDLPDKYVVEFKKGFSDKYGDRSGVVAWGYDAEKKLWWIKRKSGHLEYYNKLKRFGSLTKVDLSDVINAPFINPSNDSRAKLFWQFLRRQVDLGFPTMPTAESFLKKAKGVIDPSTGKTFVNVMWPPTNKLKRIPLSDAIPDGSLDKMQFWTYDNATATVIIRLDKGQIRLVDHRDLLKFGEKDIKTLSKFQIIADSDDEVCAKQFTSMVASIIRTGYWAGGLQDADVNIMEEE
jgi:hypothetical protein